MSRGLGDVYKRQGLTDAASKAADNLIKIHMEGKVESLNAAIACTVLTYEAMRQRRI